MRALVTGISGQDGYYLAESLLQDGWEVLGTCLESDQAQAPGGAETAVLDLTNPAGLAGLIAEFEPQQIYHLAGISSVAVSWEHPTLTAQVNGTATVAALEAAWQLQVRTGQPVAFVGASSAEIFGNATTSPQSESTPIAPVNPYGAAKALAHLSVGVYRGRGLPASSLILYNHESPRRSPGFVTRKITSTVAAIAQGRATQLRLGNLDSRRDWGWAPDYVRAMRLAAPTPGDYIIATGQARSVREFLTAAFAHVGIHDWEPYVVVDPAFYRPADPFELAGDASKAKAELGWEPSVSFAELVAAMVEADLD